MMTPTRGLRERQEPDHERDQPAGEDSAHHQGEEIVIHAGEADLFHRLARARLERVGVAHDPGDQKCTDEIGRQHDGPEPNDVAKSAQIVLAQERQNNRQRVFGEKLLPAQDDDQKTDAVAELRDQQPPGCGRQVAAQEPFAHERKPHRQTGRETGPRERGVGAFELVLPFLLDGFVNDMSTRVRCAPRLASLLSRPFLLAGRRPSPSRFIGWLCLRSKDRFRIATGNPAGGDPAEAAENSAEQKRDRRQRNEIR